MLPTPRAQRPRSTYVPGVAHAEFRVFESYEGLFDPEPLYIAYLTPAEGAALARKLSHAFAGRDARAESEMRSTLAAMDGRSRD